MFFEKATSGRNNFALYLATLFIVILGYSFGQIPLVIVQTMQVKNNPDITTADVNTFLETMDFSILGLSSNIGLVLMISIFILMAIN